MRAPRSKRAGVLDEHIERHVRVLQTAELGALTAVVPRSTWRQHELEQRDGVTETSLEWTERAVPMIGGDERTFTQDRDDSEPKPAAPSSCECTPPDIDDGTEKHHRDRAMSHAECQCRRR